MYWKKFKESKEKNLREADVDPWIKPLIKIINKNKDWVTTSSCSGRIVLLSMEKGKKDAEFYKKWHRKVNPEEVELALIKYLDKKQLWFKVEPFILHIACRDIKSANEFLKLVRKKWVKRGGIQTITDKKAMIEIQGNGQIIIPVEPSSGIRWNRIIELSNNMLEKNFKHLKELEKILK